MTKARAILKASLVETKHRAIARLAKTSRTAVANTLTRVAAAGITVAQAIELSDTELRAIVYPLKQDAQSERHEDLVKRIPDILKELGKKHMTLQFLWEKYQAEKPNGYAYSQFCEHIQRVVKSEEYYFPMDYEYGKQMFIDYAGNGHYYINKETREKIYVSLFVSILPASYYTCARFTPHQRSEDWISGTEYSIRYLGGVPASVVPDCATAIVKKASRFGGEALERYSLFAEYYGFVVAPARSHSPRDKALVENSVNNIYRWVYPRLGEREYESLEELNTALASLMQQMNERVMQKYACSRQQLFEEHERAQLKLLPEIPYPRMEYQAPRKAQFNSHMWLASEMHYYSVPQEYCGRYCSVLYDDNSVEIHCENKRIAIHRRNHIPNKKYTTNPEHMPNDMRAFMEWTPERFESWASRIGTHTAQFVHILLGRACHPTQAYKSCMGLLHLSKPYGDARLEKACELGLSFGATSFYKVESILKNNADKQTTTDANSEDSIIEHENIRQPLAQEYIA